MEQFVCLSGLPRAGSTLLSAILSQNPLIHAEGNSAVCQLMWDIQQSCLTTSKEQLLANGREKTTKHNLISQIPNIYYKDIKEKIVLDKCRSWTINANISMLENYIDKNYKIIILERSVTDVVKSFVKLYNTNGVQHRHDQSIMSLLYKYLGGDLIIDDETWFGNKLKDPKNYPIWASRKK